MGVERCSSLASTGRYRTQGLNQVKEFEKLLYESVTTILKFFLHISKDEQKERLGWASRGGAAMTPFPHFSFYLGYVDVETISLQRGIELSRDLPPFVTPGPRKLTPVPRGACLDGC